MNVYLFIHGPPQTPGGPKPQSWEPLPNNVKEEEGFHLSCADGHGFSRVRMDGDCSWRNNFN